MDIEEVESTTRKPADYVAFALVAFGNILGSAGIVTTTVWAGVLGLVLALIGLVALVVLER